MRRWETWLCARLHVALKYPSVAEVTLKKYALALCAFGLLGERSAAAQPFVDGFENAFPGMWTRQNLSSSLGSNPNWDAYNSDAITANGGTKYVMADYNSVGSAGTKTISNWLISPEVPIVDGITMTFWTLSKGEGTYFDRMQVRLSTAGASVNVGASDETVGDFSTLLLDINPTLAADVYPSVWTEYVVTVTGVAVPTTGRFAFRYFVPNSGPNGVNGAAVALDDVAISSLCGNGTMNTGEQCDDGNNADGDGCQSDCTLPEMPPACGNGTVDAGEECDDGNTAVNDGCNAQCAVEPSDSDLDGVPDEVDNCAVVANGDQQDTDGNGRGDACDRAPPPPHGCSVNVSSGRGARGGLLLMLGLVMLDVLRRVRRARRTV